MKKRAIFDKIFVSLFIIVFGYMAINLWIHNTNLFNDPNRIEIEGIVKGYKTVVVEREKKGNEEGYAYIVKYKYQGNTYTYTYPTVTQVKKMLPKIGSTAKISIDKNNPSEAYVTKESAFGTSLLFALFVIVFLIIVIWKTFFVKKKKGNEENV